MKINEQEKKDKFTSYFRRYADFIPEYDSFMEAVSSPHSRAIRVNTLKTSIDECISRLREQDACLTPFEACQYLFTISNMERPGNSLEHALGYFHVQALSSSLAAIALDPRPDDRVLDLCAAPGSKTTHLAQIMRNRGAIVANDRKWGRLSALNANMARLGITNCLTTMYHGEQFPRDVQFDRILIDAPCCGEGRHRYPGRAPLDFSRNVQKTIPGLQKRLLQRGFDLLAPGGTLLYSTCAYNPEENEAVVGSLLKSRPSAGLMPVTPDLEFDKGVTHWKDFYYGDELALCRRIYPHRLDSVGFFMAKVVKQ